MLLNVNAAVFDVYSLTVTVKEALKSMAKGFKELRSVSTGSSENIPGCMNMLIWLTSVDSAPLGCAITSANAGLL